ncbi:hypothetical protein KAX06_03790 [candidate division WOR-3 bacterium]|nr:hypothetical protein [candidate division WOR-3 bacterium]
MLKKLMVLTVVLAVAAFAAYGPIPIPAGVEPDVYPVLPLRDGSITPISSSPAAAPLVAGDRGGVTMYDYQQNGAMGNRIAVDNSGDAQICWMHSEDETFATRDVYYNVWEKASGSFPDYWPDGVKASGVPRAGYTTMGVLSDDRAVIAFHHTPTTDNISAVVVDAAPKLGAFSSPVDVDPVTVPEQPIWPHIVVGADDVIHVTAHVFGEGNPYNVNYLYYSRSTDQGQTFSPWQVLAQNAGSDAAIATSKDGSKVAVAWLSGVPVQGYPDKIASSGHINYIESTNSGVSWGSPVRITDGYYPDEAPNTTDEFYLYAWSRDLDCAYDAAGNLHIGFGEGPRSYEVRSDTLWFSYYYPYFLRMMHWSEVTNELNVASGHYSQFVPLTEEGDTVWDLYGLYLWGIAQSAGYWSPGLGCWNPQLAAIGSGDDMVFTWTGQWDSLDLSAGMTINADIYAAISTNGGATWGGVADWTEGDFDENGYGLVAYATNLTNTHSPGAQVGYCESEEYHSTYPWIGSDSILHVTYIHDLFSGSVVMSGPAQNVVTINPVMYLGSNDPAMKIYAGSGPAPTPQPEPSSVEEAPYVEAPVIELLGQHPVAGSVVFSVSAPGTHASLKIYDAAGKLAKTLFEGTLDGTRTLTWDASAVPAGVYFYSFVTPARTTKGRVVVVH